MKKIIFILIAALVSAVAANPSSDTTVVSHYENGNVKLETSWKDGKKDGIEKFYNQDGTLRWTYTYTQGVPNGVATFYYDSGAMYSKTIYADGTFVENIIFNEDGTLAYISRLEKGKCVERNSQNDVIYEALTSIDKYCK